MEKSNDKVVEAAEVCNQLPIFIAGAYALLSPDELLARVVLSHLGIYSHDDLQVSPWGTINQRLQGTVELLFLPFLSHVGWCIALDDHAFSLLGV